MMKKISTLLLLLVLIVSMPKAALADDQYGQENPSVQGVTTTFTPTGQTGLADNIPMIAGGFLAVSAFLLFLSKRQEKALQKN